LHVGRTRAARTVAALGDVAGAGRRAADGARVAGRVLARGAAAVALIEGTRVSVVRAGHPGRLQGVGGTRAARAVPQLCELARGGRRPAHRAAGLHGVGRTVGTVPGAVLGDVAPAGNRATHDAARGEPVRRTGRARPGARLGDVAH